MITKFKLFENNKKDYMGKFFLVPCEDWTGKKLYIVLVKEVDFKWYVDGKGYRIWPMGDNFTVDKNGDIKNPAGWGYHYTQEEFDKIDFLTPEEFWQKEPELCEKLYLKVKNELDEGKCGGWYCEMLNFYKNRLETVKDFEHYIDAKKYNL